MLRRKVKYLGAAVCSVAAMAVAGGCGNSAGDGKIEVEIVQYKPEAANYFTAVEEEFNATHDDIHLKISSPNDAMAILKTRFIREDYPDIIGIGGDINYSYFMDAQILEDISDYEGLANINQGYLDIDEALKFVPIEGTYAVPYVANAAGILYNRDMFEEHGWTIPTTWDELLTLCDTIQGEGILPFYFGFKDTWTCLAPWNAIAVNLCETDIAYQVNSGNAKFSEAYKEIAIKDKELLKYGQSDPVAYSYNDACTAFARGQAAMYTIGSYAIPQIKSVNPEMNIDSFVFPASSNAEENILNYGNDLMFCVMEDCEHKEEAYEVLRFLLEDENIQGYLDDQSAVPCKKGEFELAPELAGMKEYIDNGIIADYQDHHYPNEMAVDAMIQTYLFDDSSNALDTFLTRFDNEWVRYNRDIITKVQEYQEKGE